MSELDQIHLFNVAPQMTYKEKVKRTRESVKEVIEELTRLLGHKATTKYKCLTRMTRFKSLAMALAIMKLDRFCVYYSPPKTPNPRVKLINIRPELFYDAGNYLGLSFDENGRILHLTKRESSELGYPFSIICGVGCPISKICYNWEYILKHVFTNNTTSTCTFIMKLINKQRTHMFFDGKLFVDTKTGSKMFLGFSFVEHHKGYCVQDPFVLHSGFEVWVNKEYNIIKNHPWLEHLLKHVKYYGELSLFSLIHPDELSLIEKCTKEAQTKGQFKTCCRIFDGKNYLWVNVRGYPTTLDRGKVIVHMFVWPFAYESPDTEEMTMINLAKLWTKKLYPKLQVNARTSIPLHGKGKYKVPKMLAAEASTMFVLSQQKICTIKSVTSGDLFPTPQHSNSCTLNLSAPDFCRKSEKVSPVTPASATPVPVTPVTLTTVPVAHVKPIKTVKTAAIAVIPVTSILPSPVKPAATHIKPAVTPTVTLVTPPVTPTVTPAVTPPVTPITPVIPYVQPTTSQSLTPESISRFRQIFQLCNVFEDLRKNKPDIFYRLTNILADLNETSALMDLIKRL